MCTCVCVSEVIVSRRIITHDAVQQLVWVFCVLQLILASLGCGLSLATYIYSGRDNRWLTDVRLGRAKPTRVTAARKLHLRGHWMKLRVQTRARAQMIEECD